MHLRRNGSVEHGLQISLDRCERRTEIMAYVCHEFLLVILTLGYLTCHILQRRTEIAYLIIGIYAEFIMHIARSILLRRIRYPSKRQIYELRKEDKDYHAKQKQKHQQNIGYIEQALLTCPDIRQAGMNNNISLNLEVCGYGGKYRQHILREAAKEVTRRIISACRYRRVKAFYHYLFVKIQRLRGIDNHSSRGVDNPDDRIQIHIQSIQLPLYCIQ